MMKVLDDCGIQDDASSGGHVCRFVRVRHYSFSRPAGDEQSHGDKES
jgi:hypothetical protein